MMTVCHDSCAFSFADTLKGTIHEAVTNTDYKVEVSAYEGEVLRLRINEKQPLKAR
jgi:hypothetical protein